MTLLTFIADGTTDAIEAEKLQALAMEEALLRAQYGSRQSKRARRGTRGAFGGKNKRNPVR